MLFSLFYDLVVYSYIEFFLQKKKYLIGKDIYVPSTYKKYDKNEAVKYSKKLFKFISLSFL